MAEKFSFEKCTIPALKRLSQEDYKFGTSLSYITKPYLQKKKKKYPNQPTSHLAYSGFMFTARGRFAYFFCVRVVAKSVLARK